MKLGNHSATNRGLLLTFATRDAPSSVSLMPVRSGDKHVSKLEEPNGVPNYPAPARTDRENNAQAVLYLGGIQSFLEIG